MDNTGVACRKCWDLYLVRANWKNIFLLCKFFSLSTMVNYEKNTDVSTLVILFSSCLKNKEEEKTEAVAANSS